MGVSITAYSKVDWIADSRDLSENEQDKLYDKNAINLYLNPYFADRADGLLEGFYYYTDATDIMQRSYGGYGGWRNHLCQVIHGIDQEEFWEDDHSGEPFNEIIHFSDCEGFIGPKTCAKLLEDFSVHGEAIKESWEDSLIPAWQGGYFPNYVDEWIEGLVLASDGGVVVYG